MSKMLKFLVLEDSQSDFLLIERHLKKNGVEALCRRIEDWAGLEAAIGEGGWDLVISDYNLPGMDFYEILNAHRLRQPEIPFVLVSGSVGEESAVDLLKLGVSYFVLKDNLVRLKPAIERSLQDAADRKARIEAESALRESEERYRTIFENARDGMVVADSETGIILDCNQALCRMAEREKQEIVGNLQSFLHPPRDLVDGKSPTFREHRFNPSIVLEDELLSKSGKRIPVEIRGARINIGGRDCMVGIFCDITERRLAEQTVRDMNRKLSRAQRIAHIGDWEDHLPTGELHWSEEMYQIFGFPPGMPVTLADAARLFPPDEQVRFRKAVEDAVSGRTPYSMDYRIIRPDGSTRYIHDEGEIARDEAGNASWMYGTTQDITERMQSEAALRESEMWYRTLFESSREAIMTISPEDLKFRSVNAATLATFGVQSVQELLALRVTDLSPERQPDGELSQNKARRFVDMALETGSHFFEWMHQRMDGNQFPAAVLLTRVELADGDVAILATVLDITEQKRSEAEHERLSTAIEQAAEPIVITDAEAKIQYVNPAFTRITGYARDEVYGNSPNILKSGKQDEAFYRRMWDTIQAGQTWQGRLVNRRKDGTFYTEDITISPVCDQAGTITNFVAVKRDITRELSLEAQFQQAQKMEALGTLAGGIAHDFNNILGIILGYTELAVSDCDHPAAVRSQLEEVLAAAGRARDLVQQILTFSRLKDQEKKPIQLGLVVKEVMKMMRASLPTTIEIRTSVVSRGVMRGDPTQIHQVLMNLCVNAGQAMGNRGGILDVTLQDVEDKTALLSSHPDLAPASYMKLVVKDTGQGIDPFIMNRIFDPFFTTKSPGTGTGLGLSVVHGIVKSHGGAIEVDSIPDRGAAFSLYFPMMEGLESSETTEEVPLPRGREKILIVDDEASLANVMKKMLENLGYNVESCTSSIGALKIIREQSQTEPAFDLIITDMTMPQLTGVELAGKLIDLQPDLPILLCTGFNDSVDAERARRSGIREILSKPFAVKELARSVRKVLDGHRNVEIP